MKKRGVLRIAAFLLGAYTCMLFPVSAQLFGVFTVGPGGQFPSLTGPGGFFEQLNNEPGGMTGEVELRITGNLCEPGTHFLNGSKLNNFIFKVNPNPGAPLPIIINNCTDINQGLIRLDGVANTTISGLTIINTNTNPANAKPVLEFLNFSNNVIIENNTLRCNDPSITEGTLMLGGAVNSNTIIRNNIISDAVGGPISNYPGNGIYSNNATSQLDINNNTISNNSNYGIFLYTGNGTSVRNNRVCQTEPKNSSGGGINISGGGNLNVIDNTVGGCTGLGGSMWAQHIGDLNGIYVAPNTFPSNPPLSSTVSGNIIENIFFDSPGNPSFSAIVCNQGNVTMNSNIIRNCTFNANGFIHGFLLSPVTSSTYNLDLNLIDNFTNNSTGSTSRVVGLRNQGTGTVNISNLSIFNFTNFSTNNSVMSPALAGIEIASSGGTTSITGADIKNLFVFPTGSMATVTGINVNTSPNNVQIFQSKMRELRNSGLAGSSIFGINTQGGSGNITNNAIGITNNGFNNDVSVTGINFGGSSSSTYNAIYNSVFINILISSGTASTTCIRRPSSAVINYLNNALLNNSQGGTGTHTAIANTRSSSTATGFNGSNYNFLYTRDPNKVGIWNTSTQSFPSWQTISQKDNNSLTADPGNFDPLVFGDLLTGEIILDPLNPDIWYFKGNAMPVSGINTDLLGIPGTRPENILDGPPSIGAYQVGQTTVAPRNMTITGVTAPGSTQDCFFGGQKFFSTTWGMGGTQPTSFTVKRYSQAPPGFNGANPNLKSINAFFDVNATGGSGYTATATIYWFHNADGKITPINNAVMAKQETGLPWVFVPGSSYATSGSPYQVELEWVSAPTNQYSRFTAVDPLSTLPVNLLSFRAAKKNNDIELSWSTAGEADHDHFELERSNEGTRFSSIALLPGNGNGNSTKNYFYTDAGAQLLGSSKLFYRLKIVSVAGQSSYSSTLSVPLSGKQDLFSWKPGPNPFINKMSFTLYLPESSQLEFGLYNTAGTLLRKKTVRGEKGYSTVEMNGLETLLPGTYIIQLKKDGQLLSEKLLKTRQ